MAKSFSKKKYFRCTFNEINCPKYLGEKRAFFFGDELNVKIGALI
jgi:hypothetical protein